MDESIFRDCIQFSSDYEDLYTGQLLCLEIFTSITCISRWRNGIRQKNNSLGTISDIINENTWGDYKWKHLRGSIVLIKLWRARPNLGWREKINLGFYFHASSWCFRRFYEGLHKTFLRHHKDFILIQFIPIFTLIIWGTTFFKTSIMIGISMIFVVREPFFIFPFSWSYL